MSDSEVKVWLPIDTAPMDGTRVELMNAENGLVDIGCWDSYVDQPWRAIQGEWNQDLGNGDMTHWRPLNGFRREMKQ